MSETTSGVHPIDAAAGLAAGALALALTRAVAPTGAGALGTAVFVVVCLAGAALARTVRRWWTGPPQRRPEPTEVSAAIAAMAEVGIDIAHEQPQRWTDDIVEASDVVVTMGCGDTCPYFPGKRYENWELPDPAGLGVEAVRPIRDDIARRVRVLLRELGLDPAD